MTIKQIATECSTSPMVNGVYQWRDFYVTINTDGSCDIIHKGKGVSIPSLAFFRDVMTVIDKSIDNMPESNLKSKLLYESIGTSRSCPTSNLPPQKGPSSLDKVHAEGKMAKRMLEQQKEN